MFVGVIIVYIVHRNNYGICCPNSISFEVCHQNNILSAEYILSDSIYYFDDILFSIPHSLMSSCFFDGGELLFAVIHDSIAFWKILFVDGHVWIVLCKKNSFSSVSSVDPKFKWNLWSAPSEQKTTPSTLQLPPPLNESELECRNSFKLSNMICMMVLNKRI